MPFTFNSTRELIILVLKIVSKAFSILRHIAAMYSSLRKASQIFVSKFIRTSMIEVSETVLVWVNKFFYFKISSKPVVYDFF